MAADRFPGKIGATVAESTPWWPPRAGTGAKKPNVLVVLFDDVGFSDLGCYGSTIRTPAIDALAARGLRMTGFHTTAMCSTTRAALMTGCNHHRVGMGCLANFDSGYPGYRGKIAPEAATLAEMLRGGGYVNYMLGKWHVTPLSETGPTGPFDGWPLGRGYDRFYGFMDAETDQYAPELVRDNTPIPTPGSFETGYHLTADLVDQSIRYLADHQADHQAGDEAATLPPPHAQALVLVSAAVSRAIMSGALTPIIPSALRSTWRVAPSRAMRAAASAGSSIRKRSAAYQLWKAAARSRR